MKTVALAIFPGVQALDVAGPLDVFMEANGFVADGAGYDLLLVAGGPTLPTADVDPALTEWLAEMAPRCARYGSVCTGAFALGHAGLLDGRTVTTHWQNAALLAQRFP